MSWTAPRTWVTAEVVTAAMMNIHVRDNLLETAPAKVTTAGDILYATAANAIARLAPGNANQSLVMNTGGTAPQWADPGMRLITSTNELLGPNTISFLNISQIYSALVLQFKLRSTLAAASDSLDITFNNDGTASYDYLFYSATDPSTFATGVSVGAVVIRLGSVPAATATANFFAVGQIIIPGYRLTTSHKFLTSQMYSEYTALAANIHIFTAGGRWANAAAITRLDLLSGNQWATGSYVSLYGIF